MKVTPMVTNGNSSKFEATTAKGAVFCIALSFSLCTKKWKFEDEAAKLAAVEQMAEAIVGRHNPKLPFSKVYVFAEHNTEATVDSMVKYLKRVEI